MRDYAMELLFEECKDTLVAMAALIERGGDVRTELDTCLGWLALKYAAICKECKVQPSKRDFQGERYKLVALGALRQTLKVSGLADRDPQLTEVFRRCFGETLPLQLY